MSAMTWTIVLVVGMAAAGVAIGAVLASIFGGGRAGLIGLGALFGLGGAAGGWWLDKHDVQPRLAFEAAVKAADASPDVVAMKRYYPTDYQNMQRALEMAKGERKGAAGAQYMIRLHVRDVVTRQVRLGADKELVALMTLTRDEARALSARSPGECLEYFNGGKLSFDPAKALSPDLVKRDAVLAADLFQQTATRPVKDAAGAHVDDFTWKGRERSWYEVADRDAVAARAMAQFPAADQPTIKMMATRKIKLDDRPMLQAQLCKYKISLMDEALKLPEAKAAMVYRMNLGTYF
jgi:hypothetical protein